MSATYLVGSHRFECRTVFAVRDLSLPELLSVFVGQSLGFFLAKSVSQLMRDRNINEGRAYRDTRPLFKLKVAVG